MFANRELRRIVGLREMRLQVSGENYTMRLMICALHHTLFG